MQFHFLRSNLKRISFFLILTIVLLTGCSESEPSAEGDGAKTDSVTETPSENGEAGSTETDNLTYSAMTVDTELNVGKWDDGSGFSEMTETSLVFSDSAVQVSGSGASAEGTYVTISSEGVYRLSGSCAEGRIYINAGDDEHICLIFDGLSLTSANGAPIYVENAKKVLLSLADGTNNQITDNTVDTSSDTQSEEIETPAPACIYSRDDLTVGGNGTLVLQGDTNGLVTKDKLKILSGTLQITAGNNAVRGNECVAIYGGTLTITAGNDGIKSHTDNEATCGFVTIRGGSITINASGDGIHGEYMVDIQGGELNITAGGGSALAPAHTSDFEHGGWGFGNTTEETTDSQSQKGIKSDYQVILSDGEAVTDSVDDAVHSNGTITISGGEWTLSTGDDAVHADSSLTVSGGVYNVLKSYEGLESIAITISGGEGSITASDDGVNCNSDDESFFGGRGFDSVSASSLLTITGGTLVVNAGGDGLDSNGNIVMSGGYVAVNGPSDNGNGALDYAGTFQISGGTLIAAGASGMAQSVTPSDCYSLMITWPSMLSGGTQVRITKEDGTEVFSFSPTKSYNNIVICTPDLTTGSYLLYSGTQQQCSFTISEAQTSISSDGSDYSGGMGGRNPGMGGGMNPGMGGGMNPGAGGGMNPGADGTRPGRDGEDTAPDQNQDYNDGAL